jgi:hypothetical protein
MYGFIYGCFLGYMQDASCLGNYGREGFVLMKLILPLFINTLSHRQKCLFHVNETPLKLT